MADDLDAYLVRRLGQAANRDDLIIEICRRTDKSWEQAEAYLTELEARDQPRIQSRLAPVLMILSLGAFTVGLAMSLVYYFEVSGTLRALLGRSAGWRELIHYAFATTYNLPMLIAGLTLATGGAAGLITTILKREPLF
jgi:hypothetical protein